MILQLSLNNVDSIPSILKGIDILKDIFKLLPNDLYVRDSSSIRWDQLNQM